MVKKARKMTLYYVSTEVGCNLIEARRPEQARNIAQREIGTLREVHLVRRATQGDIDWVRTMQGAKP